MAALRYTEISDRTASPCGHDYTAMLAHQSFTQIFRGACSRLLLPRRGDLEKYKMVNPRCVSAKTVLTHSLASLLL